MIDAADSRPVERSEDVKSFRVWLRPMGSSWKIAVENGQGARWLTRRLEEQGFETTDLVQDCNDLHCTFRCLTANPLEKDSVENLLINWPEVKMQHSPEYANVRTNVAPARNQLSEPLHRPVQPENIKTEIQPFKVWVRPLGNAWKLRVAGRDACNWLRRELTHRQLVCSNPSQIAESDMLQFRCMSETAHESDYVWNLLMALPQVLLQNEPA